MNQRLMAIVTVTVLIITFGITVSPALPFLSDPPTENADHSQELYNDYCASCHGETGIGDGPAAYALEIAPTNFVDGDYQYGVAEGGEVPTDQALHESVVYGRHTYVMPAFPLLSVTERDAVIAYIKSLRAGGWPEQSTEGEVE